MISEDLATDPLWSEYRGLVEEFGLESCWSIPVVIDGEALASFGVYASRNERPGDFEQTLLEGVSALTGIVISRFRLKESLIRERERLEQILEATGLGIWEWNPSDESATMSDHACRLLGYEDIEAIRNATDRQLPGLIHPNDLFAFENAIKPLFDGSSDYYEIDVRYRHADGSWVWILNRGRAVERGPNGELLEMAGTIQDISSQKAVESNMRHMERIASLGELAGGLAHDFNNILTGVFGGVEDAIEELPEDHPARESLEMSKSALNRARGLTSQLLTFSKGGEPSLADVDLEKLLADVVRFDLSGTAIRHEIVCDKSLWVARVDPDQIRQVFSNLIMNARDSMESGTLRIELENWIGESSLPESYLRVTFTDDGAGIEEEHLERVFEPYFSTKARGHGLGLAICHSIVQRHRGRIHMASTPGVGTTATVYLPAAPNTTLEPSKDDVVEDEVRQLRVLVMDDEPMILRMARRLFAKLGHEVETAEDGEQAIRAFEDAWNSDEPFDLVVLDLTVRGGLGGATAAEQILELEPDAKIIASSGYADSPIIANFSEHGFSSTLPKPYSVDEIKRAIVEAMRPKQDR